MTEKLSPEQQKIAGIILAVMIVVGVAIKVSKQWFPYFLIGTIGFLILTLLVFAIEFFCRDHEYLDFHEYVSFYLLIGFVLCLIGTGTTYFIGYGIGGTSFGQASLEVYNAFAGVNQAFENSINQIVEENCKTLPPENCQLLRNTVKTTKTIQEVSDFADKLKTTSQVAEAISK